MNAKQSLVLILMLGMMVQAACAPAAGVAGTCPTPALDTELLTDTQGGYCLLYPTKYSTDVPGTIVINPASAPGDQLGDAWVSIDTEPAAGRTAAQAADAQISAAGSGFNITRSEASVDGEQAVVVDGLPGPDPWRKVFIVHDERLYTLTFLPWQPGAEGAGLQPSLETLYQIIMQSLHFLPTESGSLGFAALVPPIFPAPNAGRCGGVKGAGFGGMSVRTHAHTPKSGYIYHGISQRAQKVDL